VAALLGGASDRFGWAYRLVGLVFFDKKARSSAELRPTTLVCAASVACGSPRNFYGQQISDAARSGR